MSKPLFDENTFMGYEVNTRLFWIIFTLMMVLFTSPVAHLPFFLGYGPLVAILAGCLAVVVNLVVPLYYAHRSRRKQADETSDTVIEFNPSRKNRGS